MMHGTMQDYPLLLNSFLDHAARWHSDAEVVTARGDGSTDRVGYGALRDRSLAVSALLSSLGIRRGDTVATLAWNSQAHVETWYAVMGIGAVCHTLNPRLTIDQLASMANQSTARVLVVSHHLRKFATELVKHVPSLERLLIIDGEISDRVSESGTPLAYLDDLIGGATDGVSWGGFDETAPAGLCFTSGTTGAPKGVTYTHRSSFLHTLRILQADVMAFTKSDAVLAVVPMFHANAWGLPFAVPAVGGKLVLPSRHTDGASLARLIEKEAVTVGVGVPTVWMGLLEHVEATGAMLPSLRRIIVGGAPMPPALMARLEERLGVVVQTSWGMTELSPSGTVASFSAPDRAAHMAGTPAIGVDLLLTDADGCELPGQRNVEGHLWVRGAAVIERYFGQNFAATNAQGWFPTGDLARIDGQGGLIITGRSKELIKSGGEWINPAEIESLVGAMPEVSQAAVIGRPDTKWGERPILLVELRSDARISDEEIYDRLRDRLASWWVPDEIVRLGAMPLAPTGKIDKLHLRERYGLA
ncbi:AMP-binding protein [Sphingobium sp. DEHP117]|uniref:AMP-binding protein n=1 Tax=Sphingobium sp. DEHP117 TaxID=2993436 RepID=UPI0027D6318F|nr:AMP-binding protein [Sphingobium sp. DEHP117]MDQ4419039.1 AMP-binding protein [Sphingobium sp. DEHP117]